MLEATKCADRRASSSARFQSVAEWLSFGTGLLLLLFVLVRTGWLSDDAYVTFRTADNILHGYGPVWNVDERVQAYTHPLWLALCTVAFAITHDVFYTAIALGIVVTLVAAALLATQVASTRHTMLVCFVALLSSKAFIDFSTSGLENPLSHLLLLVFAWCWWREPPGERRLRRLTFVVSLCMLNRTDLMFLVVPAVAVDAWRHGVRASVRPLLIGFAPFVGWEIFSIVYYGSWVPNTAYAKLNSNMAASVQWERGLDYIKRTLASDPATLPVMLIAALGMPPERRRHDWPLVAGVSLYLLYVARVGGDFMMGRFFTPAFIVAVALMARARWARMPRVALGAAMTVLALGLLAPWEPAPLSGYRYARLDNLLHGRPGDRPADNWNDLFVNQIMDERREYFPTMGLLTARRGRTMPDHDWAHDGADLRSQGRQVVVREYIGLVGFFAGPEVHVIDQHALSDALLARIPGGSSYSVIGHFERDVPAGYVETLRTRTNQFADPDLAVYYDDLREVVAGPILTRRRMSALGRFITGGDNRYLKQYVTRLPQ